MCLCGSSQVHNLERAEGSSTEAKAAGPYPGCWMAACLRPSPAFSTAESITNQSSCGGGVQRGKWTPPLTRPGFLPQAYLAASFFM